jgi:NitT/TauT family transport system permease protein
MTSRADDAAVASDVALLHAAEEGERAALDPEPPISPRRSGRWRSRVAVGLIQAALVVGVLVLWQVAADRGWIRRSFSSRPTDIWDAFFDFYHSGQMATSTVATAKAVGIAFVIGTVTGTLFGFILGMSRNVDRVIGPFLVPINSIPRIALAPLFILWFGLTTSAKVWLAVSIVFFILAFNARASVKSVEPDLLVMGRVLGLRRRQMLTKVIFPSSVPALFAGVRLAITYSLLGVIGSEMLGAKDGLGQDIAVFSSTFNTASMFAVLVELAILATLVNLVFEQLERRLLRWQNR